MSATGRPKKLPSFRAVVRVTTLSCFSIACKVVTDRPVLSEICFKVRPRWVRRVRRRWCIGFLPQLGGAGIYLSGLERSNSTNVLGGGFERWGNGNDDGSPLCSALAAGLRKDRPVQIDHEQAIGFGKGESALVLRVSQGREWML